MYAIIEDSGVQYKVGKGDVIRVDLRSDVEEQPQSITFDRVLMIGGEAPRIGTPYLEGAKVTADVVEADSEKVRIVKFKRRKGYRRINGHRQRYLNVKILDIEG